ncbi:transcriptional regulator, HxlR family [Methanohalobium evestigatum Z-7303]|uniref:Transcriptional regulator, HxlR family n=1 Tax=Methanohalobium evestigatum (strain ATCC BAA-1072 / DSM 3721 / NBRC 107634 / OCM 161 / Z-7303) TaxID=644295 RepID=D7E7S3_METEZ|nr:helix-turn-helix domain-containing protein [Methanohalobium evestigatum]ADI74146.1 transcriptional regulator, HxlR family [Methanohalobium evestigatum Z-7303]
MKRENNAHCKNVNCTQKGGNEVCLCPVGNVINVVSKKWALLIIATIGNNEKIRYTKIMKNLADISPKTLADRLKELENFGLIERETFDEIPPRVEYSLTQDGIELRDSMIPLMEWASKKKK